MFVRSGIAKTCVGCFCGCKRLISYFTCRVILCRESDILSTLYFRVLWWSFTYCFLLMLAAAGSNPTRYVKYFHAGIPSNWLTECLRFYPNTHFVHDIFSLFQIQELIKDLEKRLMKFNILKPQHAPRYEHKLSEDQEKLLLKVNLSTPPYTSTSSPTTIKKTYYSR